MRVRAAVFFGLRVVTREAPRAFPASGPRRALGRRVGRRFVPLIRLLVLLQLLRLSPHSFVRLPPLLPQQFLRLRSCAANT